MQARAILEAAVEAAASTGQLVIPGVMLPLVATRAELDLVTARIVAMAEAVIRIATPLSSMSSNTLNADQCVKCRTETIGAGSNLAWSVGAPVIKTLRATDRV